MIWPIESLAKLGVVQTGSTPSTADASLWDGDIPFVTPADLDQIQPITHTPRTISEKGGQGARLLKENSVLVCCIGSLGKIGIAGRSLATNQQINSVEFDSSLIFPRYGFYACSTLKNKLVTMAPATTVPIVSKSKFEQLKIPVPPLPEQRRIAAILDQADALRAKRREALALLDSLTQSIFVEMFGDPSNAIPQFEQFPLENLLEENFQNGAYYPKEFYCDEGGVEMVHMSDAFQGVIARGNLKRVSCSAADIQKYCLNSDDIIVARRSLTYEGAAKPCMVPKSEEPLIFESSFIRVRPDKSRVTPLYLYHYLNNDRIRQKYVRPFVTQSTISGINQSNLAQISVMQPPLEKQHEFSKAVAAIKRVENSFLASHAELGCLFASLQHRAFRGEL